LRRLQVGEVLRERMEQNPRTSLLRLSAQRTCQKIVKKRLNLHPYKMSLFQELKPADYPHHVAYCSWFLNNMNDTELWICHSFPTRHGPAVSSKPDCTQGDVRTNKYTTSSIFVADFVNNYSRLDQRMHLSAVAHLVYPAPPQYNIGNHIMHINNIKTLLDS
jgi:hypothetical protein